MIKEVTLFSPYSPDLGGGGTNLRTLIPRLRTVKVKWLYTASKEAAFPGTVRIGPPMTGGTPWHDMSRAVALWGGIQTRTLRNVMAALRAGGERCFWVVGHNEGILVANALARDGARVHLTIQDDVPDGMFGRSQRYRALSPLARPIFYETLRRVSSIDVTSDGMQTYYRQQLGLSSVVVHPFVPALPALPALPTTPVPSASSVELRVGHIGSIYSVNEWRGFLRALVTVARERQARAKMVMIGLAPKFHAVAQDFPDVVELVADLPEDRAVERLFACEFLYAMYPFDRRSEVFRATSLPTKLTTYLKCQRPIFAHSPAGSTLADLVGRYRLGLVNSSTAPALVQKGIRELLAVPTGADVYERARQEVYGIENVERLRSCLEAL